ncbi:MAG: AraC family transcriptional regulator [Pseudomonadota bacterium]
MTNPHRSAYEARILRVIEHLHRTPHVPDLDELAEVACFSRFHFTRVFRGMTGRTVADAIRAVRLWRGAQALKDGDNVQAAAAAAGYGDAAGFSRAFRSAHGVSPGAFREALIRPGENLLLPQEIHDMLPVDIQTTPSARVAGLPHKGSYLTVGESFEKVAAMMMSRNLFGQTGPMTALYYDDPEAKPVAELDSLVGVVLPEGVDLPEGWTEDAAAGGRHAVLRYTGHYAALPDVYQWFYGTWLPASGEEPADAPVQEVYLNSPRDVPPEELVTEIHIPLQ